MLSAWSPGKLSMTESLVKILPSGKRRIILTPRLQAWRSTWLSTGSPVRRATSDTPSLKAGACTSAARRYQNNISSHWTFKQLIFSANLSFALDAISRSKWVPSVERTLGVQNLAFMPITLETASSILETRNLLTCRSC